MLPKHDADGFVGAARISKAKIRQRILTPKADFASLGHMTTMHPIILHHFEQSPFSEKIRIVFGLKNVDWTSVLISRIMPRPDLMPLTGGYRRTPVMQIGADI